MPPLGPAPRPRHVVKLPLSPFLIREAKAEAARIEAHLPADSLRLSYTGLQTPNRYTIGAIGELIVSRWLCQQRVDHKRTSRFDGFADDQDFIINGWRIGVKTSDRAHRRDMMQPLKQSERHKGKADVFIGCTITPDWTLATIWGGIMEQEFRERAEQRMVKVMTLCYPLAALPLSPDDLLALFRGHHRALRTPYTPA